MRATTRIFPNTKNLPRKYLFKVNNRHTRKKCEICPKFTIKKQNNVIDNPPLLLMDLLAGHIPDKILSLVLLRNIDFQEISNTDLKVTATRFKPKTT